MSSMFVQRAHAAIADAQLQRLLDQNYEARQRAREAALHGLQDPTELRRRARAIRQQVVAKLEAYSNQFESRLRENGVQVHRASDGPEANRLIVEIAQRHGAELVAKSKSMVTEEIGLNEALEAAGIRPVETDLGEFIVQLRAEKPSHILTPALHLSTAQVAESFRGRLGAEVGDDVEQINAAARAHLREVFLKAPVGLSGVNFGVAETGTLCLVTNEGNGRMVCTVPPVHIAVMGIERLVPSLDDLAVMLRLLPRFATGQKISSYVSLIHGPRHPADPDGPSERHLILVDNGRSKLAGTPLAESLLCIRCGSCLNACPVFREAGGHAYGSVYPGPIGAVVSPGLFGFEQYGNLAQASTLCGACTDACPVGIEIPRLLLEVRASSAPTPTARKLNLYTWLALSPSRFRWAQRLAAIATKALPSRGGWITQLPGPLAAWTGTRDFPPFARRPLRSRVRRKRQQVWPRRPELEPPREAPPAIESAETSEKADLFEQELRALGSEVIRCSESDAPDRIVGELYVLGASRLLAWGQVEPILFTVLQRLTEEGFPVTQPEVPHGAARDEAVRSLGEAEVGLTGAVAALAETGTLVLSTGSRRSLLPSLLPEVHMAIVRSKDIYADLESWLHAGGSQYIAGSSNLTLISGPSRTADIEMTLTVGVHGPRQLVVFLIE
ncbi:MAG: LutB/LldF family L-lactate oxidation iron-sulfur protein [Chloroflexota bacterium]